MKSSHLLIEQYKIYVASADQLSDRRIRTHANFLVVTTLILSVAGFLSSQSADDKPFLNLILVVGLLLSATWIRLTISYRETNSVKYKLICELEKTLPVKPFTNEHKLIQKSTVIRYVALTSQETLVPFLLFISFLVFIFGYNS
jgi:hypothetical protein